MRGHVSWQQLFAVTARRNFRVGESDLVREHCRSASLIPTNSANSDFRECASPRDGPVEAPFRHSSRTLVSSLIPLPEPHRSTRGFVLVHSPPLESRASARRSCRNELVIRKHERPPRSFLATLPREGEVTCVDTNARGKFKSVKTPDLKLR